MNKYAHWFGFIAVVAAIVSVVLLVLIFRMAEVTTTMPKSNKGYTIEAIALQITILEVVLAVFGTILGVVGLFGYFGIRGAAEKTAQEVAEKVANERMEKFIQQQAPSNGNTPENEQSELIETRIPGRVTEVEGAE